MELIYLYIRKYGTVFSDEAFNFSSNYTAAFQNHQLTLWENKEAVKGYYGKNVNNVVLFLGQNGMGKSSLLDILGMKRDDRINDTYERQDEERKVKCSYFMLYHLYDSYFALEFVDHSFLEGDGRIRNVDMRNEKVDGVLYKLPMGTVFKYENGIFWYCDNILLQWLKKQGVENQVTYAYITSDRYNYRIDGRRIKHFQDYLFERNYYLEENNYAYLYEYLIRLKEINNELMQERSIRIKNCIKIEDHLMDDDKERGDYLHDRKRELDGIFHLKSSIQKQMEKKLLKKEPAEDTRTRKDIFLETFYAQAIEYYFLEAFVGWGEREGVKIEPGVPIPGVEEVKAQVEARGREEKEIVEQGSQALMEFHEEYAYLRYIIQEHTRADGAIDLKKVLTYVLNRVQHAAGFTIDILDREAALGFIALMEGLPQHYFTGEKEITIDCETENPQEKIRELLELYDYYYGIRNEEYGSNHLFRLLCVELPKMSEGQRVFLDIVSKAVSAIAAAQPKDTLALLIDEPDRALHPELARKFLDTLLNSIHPWKDRSIQIVLASHSPFLVTDILPESVYAIDMREGKRSIQNKKETYATNIYYLLMDSFMLENTFGEYSRKQLKRIIKRLGGREEIGKEELENIKKVIDRVGEQTVKKKLLQLYKKQDASKTELAEKLLLETDESKIDKIRNILERHD